MRYFISGHRDLSEENFEKYYIPAIKKVMENDRNCSFVVGDCDGVDYMAQKYLFSVGASFKVYHMYSSPRNYVHPSILRIGGFKNDIERDEAMTKDSDIDIAFIEKGRWTSGTAQNILRRYEKIL